LDTPQHPDHIATARAVIDAVLDVNPPWAHVVLFATLKPTLGRFTYALDIDAYRDIKIKACRAHVSQGLFHGVRLPVPVDVYYAINHFEYFQLYEKETRPNA
jgi:LmbE family N-acetylglucosaminyl deacetylase